MFDLRKLAIAGLAATGVVAFGSAAVAGCAGHETVSLPTVTVDGGPVSTPVKTGEENEG